VDRGNRRLKLVRAHRALRQRRRDERHALVDLGAVPALTILFLERDELVVRPRAGGAPRVREQHQRHEARDLRIVRQLVLQEPAEPDGFVGQLDAMHFGAAAARIALVEDEVRT
jgi:hypothetical protein